MKTAVLLIALATLGMACDLDCQWREFKNRFSKSYTLSQETERLEVFRRNIERMKRLNGLGHAKFTLNRFSDLSPEEFAASFTGLVGPAPRGGRLPESERLRRDAIPESYFAPSVTPVRNQMTCGSCWTFASMGVLEAAYKAATGKTQQFATQQLVDCVRKDYNGMGTGCQGGNYPMAFDYLKQHAAMLESSYPYRAENGYCQERDNGAAKVVSYGTVGWDDETQVMSAVLRHGPLGVALSGDNLSGYSSGVLSTGDGTCMDKVDHAVVLVGWTTVDGIPAWIIKNSWGNTWGAQPSGWHDGTHGFMYVKRGAEGCGITQFDAFYLDRIDAGHAPVPVAESSSENPSPVPESSSHGGCVPRTADEACPWFAQCGSVSDGCGHTVSCGVCFEGEVCQGNHCWYDGGFNSAAGHRAVQDARPQH
eukprot:m51a1_g8699 putative pro-cathepsin h (422) ;mRNA; f:80903-82524